MQNIDLKISKHFTEISYPEAYFVDQVAQAIETSCLAGKWLESNWRSPGSQHNAVVTSPPQS